MEFEYEKSWDVFSTILKTKSTAKDAWAQFIGYHEEHYPRHYWAALKEIGIEEEQTDIVQWMAEVIAADPVPAETKAIWIGLLKFVDDDRNEVPTLYFGGANEYDEDDIEWATDLSYLPEERYVQLDSLQELFRVAKTDKEGYTFLDWILPLAYCAFTFDEIIRTRFDKIAGTTVQQEIFVAVGHDSGDFIELTPINQK